MYTVYYDIFEHRPEQDPETIYFSKAWNNPTKLLTFANHLAAIVYAKKLANSVLHYNSFTNSGISYIQNTIIYVQDETGDIYFSVTGDKTNEKD